MIILEGNITNKVINGKNGDFSVGNFQTEIGQFKIRSQLLDQYDEGEYRVKVAISHLDLNSYMSKRNGITITEIEAHIDQLEMLDEDIKLVDQESIEPDVTVEAEAEGKMDDKAVDKAPVKNTVSQKPAPKVVDLVATAPASNTDELKNLFGVLWPLSDIVKLDSTTPRTQFIMQKDYLKQNGYKFNGLDQTWHLEQS